MKRKPIVSCITLSVIAASLFVLAVGSAARDARSDQAGVTFTAEFPTPLLKPPVLVENASAALHVRLKITNGTGGPLRFSRYRSVLPELLDAGGVLVPFAVGSNVSRLARASDYPVLAPGQSLVIAVDAVMALRAGQIDWKGADGTLGFWRVSPASAPYRFRLKYGQRQSTARTFTGGAGTVSGLWTGETVTAGVALALQFAK